MAELGTKLVETLKIQNEEIRRLQQEIEKLQKEIVIQNETPKDWNRLSKKINRELKPLDEEERCTFKRVSYRASEGLNILIRATFNLKYIRDLDDEDYEKAEELASLVINFMKENYKAKPGVSSYLFEERKLQE